MTKEEMTISLPARVLGEIWKLAAEERVTIDRLLLKCFRLYRAGKKSSVSLKEARQLARELGPDFFEE